MSRLNFFTTPNDIKQVFSDVTRDNKLMFVAFGSHRKSNIQKFKTYLEIPDFGVANEDQTIACKSYLAAQEGCSFEYSVGGQVWNRFYSFNQLFNEETVVVRAGGIFDENTLISGEISTLHQNVVTRQLMTSFRKSLKKNCQRVQAFWVGVEAMTMLQAGKRLTMAIQSPPEYDLKI